MSDIVERLRERKITWFEAVSVMEGAASEIERLRVLVERMTWRPIATFDGMDLIDQVDLWLHIYASSRSMGMSDSFCVHDAYRRKGKWFHSDHGKEAELFSDYITHWRPQVEGPSFSSENSRG